MKEGKKGEGRMSVCLLEKPGGGCVEGRFVFWGGRWEA